MPRPIVADDPRARALIAEKQRDRNFGRLYAARLECKRLREYVAELEADLIDAVEVWQKLDAELKEPAFVGFHLTPSGGTLAAWSNGDVARRVGNGWEPLPRVEHSAIFRRAVTVPGVGDVTLPTTHRGTTE